MKLTKLFFVEAQGTCPIPTCCARPHVDPPPHKAKLLAAADLQFQWHNDVNLGPGDMPLSAQASLTSFDCGMRCLGTS